VDESAGTSYLVDAATTVTAARTAFMIRHSSGLLCVAMPASACDRLGIPLMPWASSGGLFPGAAVAVDATNGISTGISAADRARTIGILGNSDSEYTDLTRPGHVIPIRVDDDPSTGGCPDYARAALALVQDAHLGHAAAVAHLLHESGAVADGASAAAFAGQHGLELVSFFAGRPQGPRRWWQRRRGSRFLAALRAAADRGDQPPVFNDYVAY
jgi:3,4-dihydroxy-2-butanone 4-phosphate synthase